MDDDAEDDDEEVGTSFHVAEHLARRQGPHGLVEPPSGDSTPPMETATARDVSDLAVPHELRSANGPRGPGGGLDQPLNGPQVHHGLHDAALHEEHAVDARGHTYPDDVYGARKRVSGRPPRIPTEWWKSMPHKRRLEANLDQIEAQEAAHIIPNRGGSADSGVPYPHKPTMTCVSACPIGAYGLLMQCKGVAETIAQGEDTNAPGSDADALAFQNGREDEDEFDFTSYEPSV